MKLFAAILFLGLSVNASASDNVFRIEIGKDFKSYTNQDLQRRVWELERAVNQLQIRVFQLEAKPIDAPQTWSCTISAMGVPFVGTGSTKAVANSAVLDKCKAEAKDTFFCTNPKCENNKE